MAVTRATASWDGEEGTSQQMPSVKDAQTSANYEQTSGVEVRRGFGKASVANASELQPNDVVMIDGVEVKASLAREMGLLNEVFQPLKSPEQLDPNLSSGAAAQKAQSETAKMSDATAETTEDVGTGNEAYDEAAKGLNAALEAGHMEYAEAQTYDTTMAQMALAGIDVEDAVNTLSELSEGTKSELDVGSEDASMLKDAERQITQAATQSAQSELGQEGFEAIRQAAAVDPEVNEAVRGYAIQRATGKANGATWSDLLADIKAHLGR